MGFFRLLCSIFALAGRFVKECVKVPFNLFDYFLGRIFGGGIAGSRPSIRVAADAQSVAASTLEAVRSQALSAERRRTPGYSSIGETVYAYASASTPADRAAVPLIGVPEHIRTWLFELPDGDLKSLARAGRAACTKASEGKRCGVIGILYPPTYGQVAAGERGLLSGAAVEYVNSKGDMIERIRERIAAHLVKPR